VNQEEAQASLDHIKETLRSGRLIIGSLVRERDHLRAELEAANMHVKLLQQQEEEHNRRRLRVIVELEPTGDWHTLIQSRTDPSEPPDVDDSSYYPDIHKAVHHAWSVLNRLQYQFKGPHAKENL
jgi:hypothetical protein